MGNINLTYRFRATLYNPYTERSRGFMSSPTSTIRITPRLCKAARALLGWTAADLAKQSDVGVTTIRIYESEARDISRIMLVALERAFNDAGVDFLPSGRGVEFRELLAA